MKYKEIEKLPTNRAYQHFEMIRLNEENVQVDYELVLPLHEVDCRGTFDNKGEAKRPISHSVIWLDKNNNKRIPLGRTKIGTKKQDYPFYFEGSEIELPFRDGAHCQWDNKRLGLDIFYTKDGRHYQLILENKQNVGVP